MSVKSIRGKASQREQRKRMMEITFKDMMDKKYDPEIKSAEITTSEVICQSCGFKARYKFIRCPQCNEVQK